MFVDYNIGKYIRNWRELGAIAMIGAKGIETEELHEYMMTTFGPPMSPSNKDSQWARVFDGVVVFSEEVVFMVSLRWSIDDRPKQDR